MIKKYLTKVIALATIATLIIGVNPIVASAEWKQDNSGSCYTEGNSYVIGWKNINNNWYYFDNSGYMKTGWIYDNGQKAILENIDGYFVNSDGVCTNTITASEARQLILKEDGNYISKITTNNIKLSTDYREYGAGSLPSGAYWNIPQEPYYEFYVHVYDDKGNSYYDIGEYLVGKESENVYAAPNQGGMPIYQMKNNQKVKTFKYIGDEMSYEWH